MFLGYEVVQGLGGKKYAASDGNITAHVRSLVTLSLIRPLCSSAAAAWFHDAQYIKVHQGQPDVSLFSFLPPRVLLCSAEASPVGPAGGPTGPAFAVFHDTYREFSSCDIL